jgi:hypothetical protein
MAALTGKLSMIFLFCRLELFAVCMQVLLTVLMTYRNEFSTYMLIESMTGSQSHNQKAGR